MANIKSMEPLTCTRRITLEDDIKPIRQMQYKLNPIMKDVAKAKC